MRPLRSRMVKMSSSAWVGCSWAPSPALITLALSTRAKKCGAPEALCRITMKSAFNASRLRAVSLSVSPFFSDEASAVKLMISAESRCSDSSKLIRVRVEGSTKRLTTVLPRSAGTFLIARSPTALKARAVSSTVRISSGVRDSISSKCFRVQLTTKSLEHFSFSFEHDLIHPSRFGEMNAHVFVASSGQIFADEIGSDRQFTMAAIDQDSQLNTYGPAEVIQRIHGCADGASAVKDIIHQHHRFSGNVKRNDRGLNRGSNTPIQI